MGAKVALYCVWCPKKKTGESDGMAWERVAAGATLKLVCFSGKEEGTCLAMAWETKSFSSASVFPNEEAGDGLG